jgi:hypothetical protein
VCLRYNGALLELAVKDDATLTQTVSTVAASGGVAFTILHFELKKTLVMVPEKTATMSIIFDSENALHMLSWIANAKSAGRIYQLCLFP